MSERGWAGGDPHFGLYKPKQLKYRILGLCFRHGTYLPRSRVSCSIPTAHQPQYIVINSLQGIPFTTFRTSSFNMSLSEHRLFRFQKPQWLNSPNTRTAGVYLAGALVSRHLPSHSSLSITLPQRRPQLTRRLDSFRSVFSSSSMPQPIVPRCVTAPTLTSSSSTGFRAYAAVLACSLSTALRRPG